MLLRLSKNFSLVKDLLAHIFKGYTWEKKVVRIIFEKLYEFPSDKQMAEWQYNLVTYLLS